MNDIDAIWHPQPDVPPGDWRSLHPDWASMPTDEQRAADRAWGQYTPDEQDHLVTRAREWKETLSESLERLGYSTVSDYLDFQREVYQHAFGPRVDSDHAATPRHRTLGSVKAKVKRWVWRGWLPEGDVVIGEGMGGIGKSLSMVDLAARLTSGRPMPDGSPHPTGEPCDVVYITNEDDFSTVVLPRLVAAGGDPDRVHIIEQDFTMPRDLDLLSEVVRETNARLVFIDPIFSHIESAKVNPNHDSEMREHVMKPLAGVAKEAGAVVFLMRHFNKASGSAVTMRGSGSYGGMSGAARSVVTSVPEPGDDDDDDFSRRTIIGVTKSNYGAHPKALVFSTHARIPAFDPTLKAMLDQWADPDDPPVWGPLDSIPVVAWEGAAPMSVERAQQRLDASRSNANEGRQAKADAALTSILTGPDGLPANAVYAAMQRAGGYGRDATRAARDRVGVVDFKDGNSGPWVWRLPEATGSALSSVNGVTSVTSKVAEVAPEEQSEPLFRAEVTEVTEETPVSRGAAPSEREPPSTEDDTPESIFASLGLGDDDA